MNFTNREKDVYNLIQQGYSNNQIAEKLNIAYYTVRGFKKSINKKLKNKKWNNDIEPDQDSNTNQEIAQEFQTNFTKDTCSISSKSTRLKTVDDVLKFAEIDVSIWEVVNVKISSWEMPKKDGVETLHSIKVSLRRLIQNPVDLAIKKVVDDLRNSPPVLPKTNFNTVKHQNMLEVSISDHHFGKLAVNGESMYESDLVYSRAIDNIIQKTSGYNIDSIVFPIGSDFFHINNFQKTTKKGTPQDVDSNIFDIFENGVRAIVKAVYKLREIAPVDILWVPGNHDFETSFFLCSMLKAWFRKDENITVDISKNPRKYYRYGVSLIGFTHGSEEELTDLPLLLMNENKKNLYGVDYTEFHIGHIHKKKEMRFIAGDSFGNVSIKILPSLSSTDMWHLTKGYIGMRAAEAYLWSYQHGPMGNFICNLKELEM